mgnify:CR=1 FL=1
MRSYKVLNKQEFSNNEYRLVPIRNEDSYEIMKWRNEQIYHLRQSEPLTKEEQDDYFENVVGQLFGQEQPNQILFSFMKDKECIAYGGLVHINWADRHGEISFLIKTEQEKTQFSNLWTKYLELIEYVAFEELGLHKIFTYAIDLRPKLYPILIAAGFEKEAVLKEHILQNEAYIDVVMHRKLNTLE